MARAILMSMANATSPEREEEFNTWFNTVHGVEVTALPGFTSLTRYRATAGVIPPGVEPTYRYLAIYELDDADVAIQSLATAQLTMSDAMDIANGTGVTFEQIYTTNSC